MLPSVTVTLGLHLIVNVTFNSDGPGAVQKFRRTEGNFAGDAQDAFRNGNGLQVMPRPHAILLTPRDSVK